jgi:hypothetical protein
LPLEPGASARPAARCRVEPGASARPAARCRVEPGVSPARRCLPPIVDVLSDQAVVDVPHPGELLVS